jgi:hypothetical protein
MRSRLRTLLVVVVAWLNAVIGALIGMAAANDRITDEVLPSVANLLFAVTWGVTFGVIPSLGCAAVLVDRVHAVPRMRWLCAAWSAIALTSGIGLYIYAVSTAAV